MRADNEIVKVCERWRSQYKSVLLATRTDHGDRLTQLESLCDGFYAALTDIGVSDAPPNPSIYGGKGRRA